MAHRSYSFHEFFYLLFIISSSSSSIIIIFIFICYFEVAQGTYL